MLHWAFDPELREITLKIYNYINFTLVILSMYVKKLRKIIKKI